MFNVLFSLQIVAVVLSLFCIAMLLVRKNNDISKYMLLACICCFIQNAGYLSEMQSQNLDEAMMALKFEYIGGAYILTCIVFFICLYCKINISKWVEGGLFALGTAVLFCVWTYKDNTLFYTSVEFVKDSGFFPHLVMGKGILYIVFTTVMAIVFVAGIVVAVISAARTSDIGMKRNYKLLAFSCSVPTVFRVCGLLDIIKGYDPAPIGGAIGVLSFVFAIAFRHIFDVVETAHDNIMMDLDEAVIILDRGYGLQEINNKAKELFPFLLNVSDGEKINDDIFNYVIENHGQKDVMINNRFYDVLFNEVRNNGNTVIGYTLAFIDTTDAKHQLDKLNELREAADTANQAKSTFLASVSHEIRTPINVVVGMSDVILRDFDDPKLLEYVTSIQNAANSLLDLIGDILDFSKIESGKTSLVCADYEVSRFMFDLVNAYAHVGDEKGIKFIHKIDKNIPATLYGDETRIRQIMTNLLSNAFKYTKEGSVTFRAAFETTGQGKGNLIVSVEDTGIGIKRGDMDKLFEVFVRLDERVNRAVEGAGLGLNITKQLTDLMNGEIKVYSEYGSGSVFTVIIPQIVHSEEGKVVGDVGEHTSIQTKRKKVGYIAPDAEVLVVDDSKTNLIVAKALLRDTKVKVTTASSGFECLELVKSKKFNVIFLDHRMPEMDGVETLHRMHNQDSATRLIPTIMLTANAVNDARDYYLNEGFTDFISKPITEESITGIMEKYIPEELKKRW